MIRRLRWETGALACLLAGSALADAQHIPCGRYVVGEDGPALEVVGRGTVVYPFPPDDPTYFRLEPDGAHWRLTGLGDGRQYRIDYDATEQTLVNDGQRYRLREAATCPDWTAPAEDAAPLPVTPVGSAGPVP